MAMQAGVHGPLVLVVAMTRLRDRSEDVTRLPA